MRQIPKTELSPDNGAVIDTKWKAGPSQLSRLRRGQPTHGAAEGIARLPELIIYDHIGFKGAYARTNLSFHFLAIFGTIVSVRSSSSAASGAFIATNITRAITGILARVFTNVSLPKKARTTSLVHFRRSR